MIEMFKIEAQIDTPEGIELDKVPVTIPCLTVFVDNIKQTISFCRVQGTCVLSQSQLTLQSRRFKSIREVLWVKFEIYQQHICRQSDLQHSKRQNSAIFC